MTSLRLGKVLRISDNGTTRYKRGRPVGDDGTEGGRLIEAEYGGLLCISTAEHRNNISQLVVLRRCVRRLGKGIGET